jgi:hypothetical protein
VLHKKQRHNSGTIDILNKKPRTVKNHIVYFITKQGLELGSVLPFYFVKRLIALLGNYQYLALEVHQLAYSVRGA